MQVLFKNNKAIGGTTIGYCFERFGFSDLGLAWGRFGDLPTLIHAEFEWWSLKEYSNHKSTPQELGMLKRERSERFYFLVSN